MKTTRLQLIAILLFLAAPHSLRAQQASIDAPNSAAVAPCVAVQNIPGNVNVNNAKMSVRIRALKANTSLPPVNANSFVVTACDNGTAVSNKAMDAIHAAAVGAGYSCTALSGTCGGAVAGGAAEQIWRFSGPGVDCGFTLNKAFGTGTSSVSVTGMAPDCLPSGTKLSTNAGNNCGIDLLNFYTLSIVPNGVFGTINVKVFQGQGGQNPRSGTATIGSDAIANATSMKACFDGMGLGLQTAVFASGNGVQINNAQSAQVNEIQVDGLEGQLIEQDTSNAATVPVPALGAWAMAILFVLLLSTGFWILRERWLNRA